MVSDRDKPWIDWIAITDPEVTLPKGNGLPSSFKGLSTVVDHFPTQDARLKMSHCGPNPDLAFLAADQMFLVHLVLLLGAIDLAHTHLAVLHLFA